MSHSTEYYIMMIDGRCQVFNASTKAQAFSAAANWFDYDEFDQFLDDVSLCEYKNDAHRVVECYSFPECTVERFHIDTPYQLSDYVGINLHA